MKSSVETITPEKAIQLLEKNINNRRIRHAAVASMSAIIKRGAFITTHQGIAIADDGEILDGQHRLMAIVKANMSVDIMVTRGVQKQAFSVVDCGIIELCMIDSVVIAE